MNYEITDSTHPDRLKVFISSSMEELFEDRKIIDKALKEIGIEAWTFEDDAGARAGTIQDTYLTEVERCDLFIAVFWKKFGDRSIEEYEHAQNLGKDCLIFERRENIEDGRDPRLQKFLDKIGDVEIGITTRRYSGHSELSRYIKEDVARWQSEVIRRQLSMGPGAGRLWTRHVPIIIPAKNEEKNIVNTIRSMLEGPGGSTAEIIVVDDCSEDSTIEKVQTIALLNPYKVKVIKNTRPEQRKVGAVLTGLEYISTKIPAPEYVALIDADTVLEKVDLLDKPNVFDSRIENWNFDACAFRIQPKQSPSNLTDITAFEYTIGTDSLRNILHSITCISGAGSVWRRETIISLLNEHSGLFQGDDLETTLLAHERSNLKIIYEPSIIAKTFRPKSFRSFLDQRLRWDIGLVRNVIRPRFWRTVMMQRSNVSASYRVIFIADVILHPLKILAFISPFILFANRALEIAPPFWREGQPIPYLNSPYILLVSILLGFAIINGLIVKGTLAERLRISGFGFLYLSAPYMVLVFLLVTAPNQPTGIVVDDQYLSLSYEGELKVFLRTILIPFALSLVGWWVPLTHLILRQSSDPSKRRVGIHTLVLPFVQLWHLLVIRTISVLLAPFSNWQNYNRIGKWAVSMAFILIFAILIIPTVVITSQSEGNNLTSQTSEEWLLNSMISSNEHLYVQSYPNYRPDDFWIYDASLAIIALNENKKLPEASSVLKGLQPLQNKDGSFHTAYRWVDENNKAYPLDDRVEIAPNAWILIAALRYEAASMDTSFQTMTQNSLKWLLSNLFIDKNNSNSIKENLMVDTREMAVAYAALRLANQELIPNIDDKLLLLEEYLQVVVWDQERKIFLERPDVDIPGSVVSQTLAVMALAGGKIPEKDLFKTLEWVEDSRETTISVPLEKGFVEITGLSYTNDFSNIVYGEGTFQLSAAFQSIGNSTNADSWSQRGERMRTRQGGVFYAIGSENLDFAGRPALAPTAWLLICKHKVNPLQLIQVSNYEITID